MAPECLLTVQPKALHTNQEASEAAVEHSASRHMGLLEGARYTRVDRMLLLGILQKGSQKKLWGGGEGEDGEEP